MKSLEAIKMFRRFSTGAAIENLSYVSGQTLSSSPLMANSGRLPALASVGLALFFVSPCRSYVRVLTWKCFFPLSAEHRNGRRESERRHRSSNVGSSQTPLEVALSLALLLASVGSEGGKLFFFRLPIYGDGFTSREKEVSPVAKKPCSTLSQ